MFFCPRPKDKRFTLFNTTESCKTKVILSRRSSWRKAFSNKHKIFTVWLHQCKSLHLTFDWKKNRSGCEISEDPLVEGIFTLTCNADKKLSESNTTHTQVLSFTCCKGSPHLWEGRSQLQRNILCTAVLLDSSFTYIWVGFVNFTSHISVS